MLTIWGGLVSMNVKKVIWCADELGLEYTHIPAGLGQGVNDTAAFRAMNPNGLVPAIDDNGFVTWESNAIVRYLGARYGDTDFCPADPTRRQLLDRWMDWTSLQFYPAMRDAFFQLVRSKEDRRDPAVIDRSLAEAEKFAAILDQHLAGRDFANGAHFSMADIVLGVTAHRWTGLPTRREKRPNLDRWIESLRARKAASKVLVLPLV